jgi:hypothetical protein
VKQRINAPQYAYYLGFNLIQNEWLQYSNIYNDFTTHSTQRNWSRLHSKARPSACTPLEGQLTFLTRPKVFFWAKDKPLWRRPSINGICILSMPICFNLTKNNISLLCNLWWPLVSTSLWILVVVLDHGQVGYTLVCNHPVGLGHNILDSFPWRWCEDVAFS